ncbi:MAG: hypothetical protein M3384_01930 [Acidobacteriota bacterium]|nr:hypothetical protein [Acidobacteriota bacterium]
MSYHLTITNHYHQTIMGFGMIINAGEKNPIKVQQTLGNGYVDVPGLGAVNFTDIGQKDIGGHSRATWGVLISYQGEEIVFRYEGGGEIQLRINELGQAELRGNGEFSRVQLPSFVLVKS